MNPCKLTGKKIRILVLSEMIKGGVKEKFLSNAFKISWPKHPKILGTSTKVVKGEKDKILTSIIYLAPEKESVPYGGKNICAFASVGCSNACLGSRSARLRMSRGLNSKLWKTLLWLWRPDIFRALLFRDIQNHEIKALKKGFQSAIRMNGSSDILWEVHLPELFTKFPHTVFYDYTKIEHRMYRQLPPNYHLTFSRSEDNDEACIRVLNAGKNVAIVFSNLDNAMESDWNGFPVFNADDSDYRPGDAYGVAGLGIKANVKTEESNGFIVDTGRPPKRKREEDDD